MARELTMTYTTAIILQTIRNGHPYGFEMMDVTGLPSGTVYPALRRLEEAGLIRSQWEKEKSALAEKRPARRYYAMTAAGETTLEAAGQRFRLLGQLVPAAGKE